jgi:hypothetical protein
VTASPDSTYRLDLAGKLAARARDEITRRQWREGALFARGSIENAAKAIVACFQAVPRSHEPGALLASVTDDPRFPVSALAEARAILPRLDGYGMDEHVRLSYGDEQNRIDPWSLVTEDHAQDSLGVAEAMLTLANTVVLVQFG